nr:unnamed protein product [Callosobruchus chinensis]
MGTSTIHHSTPFKLALLCIILRIGKTHGAALLSNTNSKPLENSKSNENTNKTFLDDLYYDDYSGSLEQKETKKNVGTSEEIPAPEPLVLPGYNLPENIFNKGKPFYIEKDPETGKIDFNKKTSDVASKLYDENDYYDDESMEASESIKYATKTDGQDANKGGSNNNIYDKSNIDRKDGHIDNTYSSSYPHKHSNDINQLTTNFHDFLNLPVKYNPQKYVYPLISSSYASTKIQGSVNKLHNHKDFNRYNDKNYSYSSGTKDTFVQTTSSGSNNIGSDYSQSNNNNKNGYSNSEKEVTSSSTSSKHDHDYVEDDNEDTDYSYTMQDMNKAHKQDKNDDVVKDTMNRNENDKNTHNTTDIQHTKEDEDKVTPNIMNTGMGNHPDFGEDFDYYDDYTTKQVPKASSTTKKTNINDLYLTTKSPKAEITSTMRTTLKLNVFSAPTSTKRPLSLFEQLFGDYDETVAPIASSSTITTPASTSTVVTSTSSKVSYSESSGSQLNNGHASPNTPNDQNYDYMDEYNDKYEHEDNLAVPSESIIKKQENEEDDLKIEPLDGNNHVNTDNTKYDLDSDPKDDQEGHDANHDSHNQKQDKIMDKIDDAKKIVTSMPIDLKEDDDSYSNKNDYSEPQKEEAMSSTVASIASTPSTLSAIKITSMPLGENHVTSGSLNPGIPISKDPIIVATQNLKEKLNGEKVLPRPFEKGPPPSVSNIHILPNQDSVSFVMGNHQKVGDGSQHLQGEVSVGAGGQYIGSSIKDSPYDSNPFKPYFNSGSPQNGQYVPQKGQLLPTATGNDYNHHHQHGFSAITIQPLKNSEASLAIGVPINNMKPKPGQIYDEKIDLMPTSKLGASPANTQSTLVPPKSNNNRVVFPGQDTMSTDLVPPPLPGIFGQMNDKFPPLEETSTSVSQKPPNNKTEEVQTVVNQSEKPHTPSDKAQNSGQQNSLNSLDSYQKPSSENSASDLPLGSNIYKDAQNGQTGFDSYQKPPSMSPDAPFEVLRPPHGGASPPPSSYGGIRPLSPGLGAYHTNVVGPGDQKLHDLENREVLKLNSRPMYHQLANDLMTNSGDGEEILRPPPRPDLRPIGRPPYDPRPGHFHSGKIEYNRPPRPQLEMAYKRIDNLPNILPQFRPNALRGKPANSLGPNMPLGGHGKYPGNPNSRIGNTGIHPPLDRPSTSSLLYYEKKPFVRQPLLERPSSNRPIGFFEKMYPHPGHRNQFFQGKSSYPVRKNNIYTSNMNNSRETIPQIEAEERIINKNVNEKGVEVTSDSPIGFFGTPPQPKIIANKRKPDDESEIETLQMIQAKNSEKSKLNQDSNPGSQSTESDKNDDKQRVKIDSDGQVVTISAQEVDENSNLNNFNNEEDKQKEKTIYKVYPINSGPVLMDALGIHNKQTPVVVGALSEIPLPPSKISTDQDGLEGSPSLLFDIKNRNDDPVLQPQSKPGSYPVKNDFPYKLERPDMSLNQHDSISVPNQSNNDLEEGYNGNGGYTPLPSNQISATLKTYTERPIAIAYTPTEPPESHQQNAQHFVNEYMPADQKDQLPQNEKDKNEFTVTAVIHTHPQYNQGLKPGQQYPYINHRPPTHGQVATMINHRIDSDVDPEIPKLGFEAPFVASSNIENTQNNGWTVISKEPQKNTTNAESRDTSAMTTVSYASSSEFDIENFKPQLEGGFKPIYSLTKEDGDSRENINERGE